VQSDYAVKMLERSPRGGGEVTPITHPLPSLRGEKKRGGAFTINTRTFFSQSSGILRGGYHTFPL